MTDPVARRTDPPTSHAAARKAKWIAPPHRTLILNVLWRPMNAYKIASLTGLSMVQVDRRMHELVESGDVRDSGQVVDGCICWERINARSDCKSVEQTSTQWGESEFHDPAQQKAAATSIVAAGSESTPQVAPPHTQPDLFA